MTLVKQDTSTFGYCLSVIKSCSSATLVIDNNWEMTVHVNPVMTLTLHDCSYQSEMIFWGQFKAFKLFQRMLVKVALQRIISL